MAADRHITLMTLGVDRSEPEDPDQVTLVEMNGEGQRLLNSHLTIQRPGTGVAMNGRFAIASGLTIVGASPPASTGSGGDGAAKGGLSNE